MSNYASLKATINANIKTNGNQEITGSVLNSVLTAMTNALGAGYQYLGVATPTSPGTDQTPDHRGFYIATKPGTYSHLGGLVVYDGEVAILKWDTSWRKEVTGMATDAELTELREMVDYPGQNYAPRCTLNSTGGIDGNPGWFVSMDYIPVHNGDSIVWNPGVANWGGYLCLYDSDKNFLTYFSANAAERTIVLNNADVAYIRAPFYMDNLANAKIVRNGEVVWTPTIKEDGVKDKVDSLADSVAFFLREQVLPYLIQNGTPGNYADTNYVVIRGKRSVTIPGVPGHRYRINISKTPHQGYNFYFRLNTYSTISPSSFTANRVRAGSDNWNTYYMDGDEFSLNNGEYGITLMLGELTAPSASASISPLRESDFNPFDIHIVDITESILDELRHDIDTRLSNVVKYSEFSPVKGKYVTDSGGSKTEASNSQISYIEIPIDKIDERICLKGFTYTPSSATPETYTSIVFFDGNNTLLSREYNPVNGVLSLAKPNGAASCYINAPVAHIDELSVFTDMTSMGAGGQGSGLIMTDYSASKNVQFGASSLTISKKGFSYIVDGVRYDIAGDNDYVFTFYANGTRRYLCLDTEKLLNGSRSFSELLSIINETTPGIKYVVLMATYIGRPQGGLFFNEYLRTRQEADSIGDAIIVDYAEKGKDFTALFANAQDAVSFLFFTDPHTAAGSSYDPFGTQIPMLKTIQQYYQSLPFDFVLSGGDWLNNADTQAQACYKLGQIKQQLKTRMSPCYMMLGNHDTNYQGVALSQESINTLWFNDYGKSYYRAERHNCALYVFDSGTDGRTTISAYEQEQLAWFAQSLFSETSQNIIIASHIIIAGSSAESSIIQPFAEAIEQIAGAYNSRSNVVVNGYEYIFENVTGNTKVRCFIGGHTHFDYMDTTQPIPIFITLNAVATNALAEIWGNAISPRFDMILIDFTEGKLHSVRVGDGNNRTMNLA